VLVPEGRLDFDWLRLLSRSIDLREGWAEGECRFSAHVGVVPTHDAALTATIAALSHAHPRLTALVDGDAAGRGYAEDLAAARIRPSIVACWPDGWTVEDVVGWLLDADSAAALATLADALVHPPATVAELVARLKSLDRPAHGLKQDLASYEAIAETIGSIEACRARARNLLNALADALLEGRGPLVRFDTQAIAFLQ
jgi:DNA primase